MATEAQIRANRANAKKSTGPHTPEGKARSSRNALKHGFRSHTTPQYPDLQSIHRDLERIFDLELVAFRQPLHPVTAIRKLITFQRYEARPARLLFQAIKNLHTNEPNPPRLVTRHSPLVTAPPAVL